MKNRKTVQPIKESYTDSRQAQTNHPNKSDVVFQPVEPSCPAGMPDFLTVAPDRRFEERLIEILTAMSRELLSATSTLARNDSDSITCDDE